MLFPELTTDLSNVFVPEELVQVQSYLRWERSGKQNYSIEQQKVCFMCYESLAKIQLSFVQTLRNQTCLHADFPVGGV